MPKFALKPETAYYVWLGAWGVAGAALLWRRRRHLMADTDGRTGWSADTGTIASFFGLYAGGYLALGGLAAGLAKEVASLAPENTHLRMALTAAFAPALLMLLLVGMRRFLHDIAPRRPHRVSPAGPLGFTPAGILHGFAGAMVLTYGTSLIWGLLLRLAVKAGLPDWTKSQDLVKSLVESRDLSVLIPLFLGAVIFAPMQEELFYRGGVFAAMRAKLPRISAYLLSGALFALMHWNVAAFLPLLVLGAWLAKLYDTTADLRVPVTVHALFNLNTIVWAILAPGAIA